jgi:hypothetical protein
LLEHLPRVRCDHQRRWTTITHGARQGQGRCLCVISSDAHSIPSVAWGGASTRKARQFDTAIERSAGRNSLEVPVDWLRSRGYVGVGTGRQCGQHDLHLFDRIAARRCGHHRRPLDGLRETARASRTAAASLARRRSTGPVRAAMRYRHGPMTAALPLLRAAASFYRSTTSVPQTLRAAAATCRRPSTRRAFVPTATAGRCGGRRCASTPGAGCRRKQQHPHREPRGQTRDNLLGCGGQHR